jgi:hypothetical protein
MEINSRKSILTFTLTNNRKVKGGKMKKFSVIIVVAIFVMFCAISCYAESGRIAYFDKPNYNPDLCQSATYLEVFVVQNANGKELHFSFAEFIPCTDEKIRLFFCTKILNDNEFYMKGLANARLTTALEMVDMITGDPVAVDIDMQWDGYGGLTWEEGGRTTLVRKAKVTGYCGEMAFSGETGKYLWILN